MNDDLENELEKETKKEVKKESSEEAPEESGEDDIVYTEDDAPTDDPEEKIRQLKEKLKKCLSLRQEYLDGWQRAKADLINARKRDQEERHEFVRLANERLIEGLLPALESFDMAMGNKEAWEKADKNWRLGVEYIYSQITKTLAQNGLMEINPIGKRLDHREHEAVGFEPVHDKSLDQTVTDVIQKGYSLNGKIIKPAKVKVGEFQEKE